MGKFGDLIKEARIEREVDQKDVQMETGIDYTLLSRLEKGERLPSKEQVYHLADFYSIKRRELLIAWNSDKVISCFKDVENDMAIQIIDNIKETIRNKE